MAEPGLLTLIGSGEAAPSGRVFYEPAFRRVSAPVSVSILETPAGYEPNSSDVANRVADFIRHSLQNYKPDVSVVPARRRDNEGGSNDPATMAPLLGADCIFMGPGSPSYAVRHLHGTYGWDLIKARHHLGASLTFASGACIAIGELAVPIYEIYKVGDDPHWMPGLDLLGGLGLRIIFVTHWNNTEGGAKLDTSRCFIGRERMERLIATMPRGVTLLGIDEHTALTLDFASEECQVVGKGTVTLTQDGQARSFGARSCFPMSELGTLRIPEKRADIRAAAWETASAAASPAESPAPALPADVEALIAEREAARAAKRWAEADALRELIAAKGYAVTDTPQGPQWRPR